VKASPFWLERKPAGIALAILFHHDNGLYKDQPSNEKQGNCFFNCTSASLVLLFLLFAIIVMLCVSLPLCALVQQHFNCTLFFSTLFLGFHQQLNIQNRIYALNAFFNTAERKDESIFSRENFITHADQNPHRFVVELSFSKPLFWISKKNLVV
jgi:hypothetical protein